MILFSKIEGQGFPLLIIHGFLGMSDNWKSLSTQYANQGFQVHSLDMRNHGKSFHSDDFSYDLMVQDVLEYCSFHNLQSVNLIGHSMGGKVAMLMATENRELVNKLIVADIGPKFYAPHHQTILAALNAIDFSRKPSRNEAEAVVAQFISDVGTRQFLLKNLYWKTPEQLSFRFNLKVFNTKIDQIGQALPFDNYFSGTTLFLRGEKSDYILDADFETIYHHFPIATIQTIPNAGHWLHAENPKAFLEHTLQFLQA